MGAIWMNIYTMLNNVKICYRHYGCHVAKLEDRCSEAQVYHGCFWILFSNIC